MSASGSRALAAAAVAVAVLAAAGQVRAQCAADEDCRYGRVCREGRCTYPEGACERDVDCPEGAICESGRCVRATPAVGGGAPGRQEELLPPPRPLVLRGLRPRSTDGGTRFVDPIEWGGRGSISPRPHGTSVFDFQYGSGEVPCPAGCSCPLDPTEPHTVNAMQLTLGGDSVVADIVDIGFTMALFRWSQAEGDGCTGGDSYSIGDVQMRLSVLAYRNVGPNHWFGLTPFVRLLLSAGSGLLVPGSAYYALIEPGVALGYAHGMISASLHLSGIVGLTDDETLGFFLSHLSFGLRPIELLAVIADLEVGYGMPGAPDAVPVAVMAGLRLFIGRMLAIDVATRVAATEAARYSDANAAAGLWSLGVRLSVVWRGLGRP